MHFNARSEQGGCYRHTTHAMPEAVLKCILTVKSARKRRTCRLLQLYREIPFWEKAIYCH
uniref:Uncharacterized protein n=1 Tax=Anguilla anguilla TaxID=7936 RepID=A0A0E9PVE4_ANGAN